ncbi:MAG TPA: hypothetical protein VMM14_02050 [Acidimicrobiia bacterium]|nr:hypothetical protein [Acidimicrobiia bacterium]
MFVVGVCVVGGFVVLLDVAGSAVELAFVDGGGFSVRPVVLVVDVAVSGFGSASGALAVSVAGGDGPALGEMRVMEQSQAITRRVSMSII